MVAPLPTLEHGRIGLRPIKVRDSKVLERELLGNRTWLRAWEATNPYGAGSFDVRGSIRSLLAQSRQGTGLPFVLEYDGEFAGQLNVSGITYGSVSSATLGYWVSERFAGRDVTPTGVALVTDYCFERLGLHRMEICIRPSNAPSLRVVEKLGFRYEGMRRRYIHINGEWADHFCFALVREELNESLLTRWLGRRVPPDACVIPEADRLAASAPLRIYPTR
ncbi:GNAT family N-acetyltransferase [Paramicrobacterium agarici]|uniref:Ribosomal-protein-alanine N-acetyltransferase n=1 Tax=Paramicrobacterium agarici TaxID=630514 RepID=A0A2A9DY09_9MICO|nr:GNAT family protein [Microbacterium agarici]PFG30819.1 ribosomal-protein-alanine N-acetyltransferase [Microbacterium agarici]TQO23886.1 ribosomal-protein-alanine N-acetyltransferase [Microbacterium agarici]